MKNITISLIFNFLAICIYSQSTEHYLRITINDRSDLKTLTQMVYIDNVIGNEVIAYANGYQLERLKISPFEFEELEHPSVQAGKAITMATTVAEMENWDKYPTYSVYNQLMAEFVTNYPNLCKLDTIGTSIAGRNILALNITADINTQKAKPEVLLSSTMHGNETTGWILCMRLADYLTSNYGADMRITSMLDSISIFIAPNTNPDGTYRPSNESIRSARRTNSNGSDLNRNFPDPRAGLNPDGAWQKETMVMMDYANARYFILGANFHGGTEVANYPWDTWRTNQRKHSDNDWYVQICRQYATLAQANGPANYFRAQNNGITNGGDWYIISGGRQDYMNYWHNCREITLEVSNAYMPQSEDLPIFWNANREALLTFIENVKYGIRGFVTNMDGEPLYAKITIVNHDQDNSHVYTNPAFGNYYRMIQPGTFKLLFESDGYQSQTFSGIVSQQNKATILNVVLRREGSIGAIPYITPQNIDLETGEVFGNYVVTIQNVGNQSFSYNSNLTPEQSNEWLSLSNNSGVLEAGELEEIILSYNFTLFAYGVYTATLKVDVTDSIIDIPINIDYKLSTPALKAKNFSFYPNPAKNDITISIPNNSRIAHIEIFTLTGQKIHTRQFTDTNKTFTISDLGIKNSGVYFIKIQTDRFVETVKLVVE